MGTSAALSREPPSRPGHRDAPGAWGTSCHSQSRGLQRHLQEDTGPPQADPVTAFSKALLPGLPSCGPATSPGDTGSHCGWGPVVMKATSQPRGSPHASGDGHSQQGSGISLGCPPRQEWTGWRCHSTPSWAPPHLCASLPAAPHPAAEGVQGPEWPWKTAGRSSGASHTRRGGLLSVTGPLPHLRCWVGAGGGQSWTRGPT